MRVGLEDEGVLRSIVAMLNSKGGEVVIGVLEEVDFASADEQRLQALLRIDDKIIIGLEPEYDKKGWDSYHRRLTELIESRIGPDVLDQELIEVARLTARDGDSGSVFDICRVVVRPSETRQYLNGELFFIRRGNKTERLKGPEIDRYWQAR